MDLILSSRVQQASRGGSSTGGNAVEPGPVVAVASGGTSPTRRLPPRVPTQVELGASRGFAGAGAPRAAESSLNAFDGPGLPDEAVSLRLPVPAAGAAAATVPGVDVPASTQAPAAAGPRGFPRAGDPALLDPSPSSVSDGGGDAGLRRSCDDAIDARKGSSACEGVCATGRAACAKVLAYFERALSLHRSRFFLRVCSPNPPAIANTVGILAICGVTLF